MTPQAAISALAGLALMLAVAGAYAMLARRFRVLWHPLSIVAAVTIVGVTVSVLGGLLWGGGWAGVPAMARRSAIGGVGWGLIIAALVWIVRRGAARLLLIVLVATVHGQTGTPVGTAIEEQLGLKLVSQTGQVEVLVIDTISEPAPN